MVVGFFHVDQDVVGVSRCVSCHWLSRRLLQLVLASGAIVTLVVSSHTGDVDRIFVDKSLVGKLTSEVPSDGKLNICSFLLFFTHCW